MKQSVRLGKIAGIPVGLHWGLLVIAWLQAASLAGSLLPAAAPGLGQGIYWLAAVASVVLFFGSIFAHELGHSLVAQRAGIRVKAITLWFLGGVAELDREADRPEAELRIALAGPAVSLLLAGAFLVTWLGIAGTFGSTLVGTVVGWLAFANLVLGIFNLIPAAPLDGGRVLAALLWMRRGDAASARATSARAGRGFGLVMLVAGGALLLLGVGGGFTLIILGWFLRVAAGAELRHHELRSAAARIPAAQVMAPMGRAVDQGVTVAGLQAMVSPLSGSIALPVRGSDGEVMGYVTTSLIGRAGRRMDPSTPVGQLAVPFDRFVGARAVETLDDVLTRLRTSGADYALVYDGLDRQVGVIGQTEIGSAPRATPTSA